MRQETKIESKCSECGKRIIFMRSAGGGLVPCDPKSISSDDIFYNRQKHIAHFVTCIKGDKLRKKYRRLNEKKQGMTAEEIEQERIKVYEESRKKIEADKRPFVVNNKIKVTTYRYSLLNKAANLKLGYEELISWTNQELVEWLSEKDELRVTSCELQAAEGSLFEQ